MAGVLAGIAALVQSATGFGFALILSPVLFALLEPPEALFLLLLLGLAVNVLVLFGERRPRRVRGREVASMLVAALPGAALGLAVLAALDKGTLQVVIGVLVIGAAAVQLAAGRRPTGGTAAPAWTAYPAGVAAGVLTTSTSLSGPPLVLWLLARRARPGEVRDSLAASFLALNVAGASGLLLAGGIDRLPGVALLTLLVPTVLGQVLGRRAFERLDPSGFRAAALVLVTSAGAASVLAGAGAL